MFIIVGGGYRGSGSSCTTPECRRRAGIIAGSVIGGILAIVVAVFSTIICCIRCTGRPFRKNSTFVKSSMLKNGKDNTCRIDPFTTGIWSGRYFQYGHWHGPHKLSLSFKPQSMKVTGSGTDDVGSFTVDGVYSNETNRIGLTKNYQRGTGNPSENLGHQVTIQLTWNHVNNVFEGKWYVQTHKYHGENKFELTFKVQKSSQYRIFNDDQVPMYP